MINIEEITVEKITEFWDIHIKYLVDDGIILEVPWVCRKRKRRVRHDAVYKEISGMCDRVCNW